MKRMIQFSVMLGKKQRRQLPLMRIKNAIVPYAVSDNGVNFGKRQIAGIGEYNRPVSLVISIIAVEIIEGDIRHVANVEQERNAVNGLYVTSMQQNGCCAFSGSSDREGTFSGE